MDTPEFLYIDFHKLRAGIAKLV